MGRGRPAREGSGQDARGPFSPAKNRGPAWEAYRGFWHVALLGISERSQRRGTRWAVWQARFSLPLAGRL